MSPMPRPNDHLSASIDLAGLSSSICHPAYPPQRVPGLSVLTVSHLCVLIGLVGCQSQGQACQLWGSSSLAVLFPRPDKQLDSQVTQQNLEHVLHVQERRGKENESLHPHPGLDLQTIARSEDSQILITILTGRRVQGESHPIKPQSAVLSWDAGN